MGRKLKGPDGNADKFIPVTFNEKRRLVLKSILVVLVLDYFFYRSLLAVIPLSALGCFYFQRERKILLHKKKKGPGSNLRADASCFHRSESRLFS